MSNPKNNSDQTSRQNEYSAEDRRLSQGSSIHSHSYWNNAGWFGFVSNIMISYI